MRFHVTDPWRHCPGLCGGQQKSSVWEDTVGQGGCSLILTSFWQVSSARKVNCQRLFTATNTDTRLQCRCANVTLSSSLPMQTDVAPVWWIFIKWQYMGTYLLNNAFFAPPATLATTNNTTLFPSTLARWREPCNNPPCFHGNHLLLSSPHLSFPPSLFTLPLCCLHTLLVFQGQRGSQSDSEIERDIGGEMEESRPITTAEKEERGSLEDINPPDIVIVSTLDPRQ